ncbi:MAG: peptidylprolyl isomerase [Solirubrobacterales bacterium]
MTDQNGNRSRLIFLGGLLAAGAVVLVIVLVTGGGDDGDGSSSAGLPDGCEDVPAAKAKDVKLDKPPQAAPAAGTTATVETSCGAFTISFAADSPKTAASFVYMAEQGAYDGTSINRIAPGFVIQGGDPTETQAGNAGYTVEEPPPDDTVYSTGVVAMAKSQAEPPGTSGSQFFVVTAPADAGLPPDYAVLGKVESGQDVVDRIESVGTESGGDGPPKSPVVIKTVTIKTG